MSKKNSALQGGTAVVDLGDNPVNAFQARIYAQESSPSTLAVLVELTENARDNATEVTLTLDVERVTTGANKRQHVVLRRVRCEDNGTGLTHAEFLNRFCGAFSDSEIHRDVDRAGRNGVGTKTYTSIASAVLVETTTARPTEGLDSDRLRLTEANPGIDLPADGAPDTLWRKYEFRLHRRLALAQDWTSAEAEEMGTRVELSMLEGTTIDFDALIERLSYSREWLQNPVNSLRVRLIGNLEGATFKKEHTIKPWTPPNIEYLAIASGRSSDPVVVWDRVARTETPIAPDPDLPGVLEFDFRVAGNGADGRLQEIGKPALLLEICGALPYATNPESKQQSARTAPLLAFLGLANVSSIGAFSNAICGYARINAIALKECLRNNKTTLATGPGAHDVERVRRYLSEVIGALHKVWYNASQQDQDEIMRDTLREAAIEVNLALKGVNRGLGLIARTEGVSQNGGAKDVRRHRWECGSCDRTWFAAVDFVPTVCAETTKGAGQETGCGSTNIGLSKNQPRVAECEIRLQQLGARIPAIFELERQGDLDQPVVIVNLASPRYLELRGSGQVSGQKENRLKQYIVDIAFVAIATDRSRQSGTELAVELGDLYHQRMLRSMGVKEYEKLLAKQIKAREEQVAALS